VGNKAEEKVLVDRYGGRFHLTAIVQKRLHELVKGARPLVEVKGRPDLIDIVLKELQEGRIEPSEDAGAAGAETPDTQVFRGSDEGSSDGDSGGSDSSDD
jgi:DNA-directed RNA polymerase subunit K/omega